MDRHYSSSDRLLDNADFDEFPPRSSDTEGAQWEGDERTAPTSNQDPVSAWLGDKLKMSLDYFPALSQLATRARKMVLPENGSRTGLKDLQPTLPILQAKFIHSTRLLTSQGLFVLLVPIYIFAVALLSRAQSFAVPPEKQLNCLSTFWPAPYDRCGLDGQECGPFNDTTFSYRCPADCSTVYLHNTRIVGDQDVAFQPLVVGGGDAERTYRGDSWICASAMHAGLVSDSWGGCVTVDLVGAFTGYLPSSRHGMDAVGFASSFPLSFRLSKNNSLSQCTDLRSIALAFNAIITFVIFAIFRPRPRALYWALICIGFWHVSLFSQPRSSPPDLEFAFATFLPTLFVCHTFWLYAARWVLPELLQRIPLEGAVLYLGPYWITVLNNLTLDRLPVDRLMIGDITRRAGGLATLVAGIVVIVFAIFKQVLVIRRAGHLPQYLKGYGIGAGVTLVLALLPTLNLRVHHYIFAIMFIPGTAFPTRLSAVFQGFLLGMFLNGVAAWGFDGILQTTDNLRRDAPAGTPLPELGGVFDAALPWTERVVHWASIPENVSADGFRLLVDDVERYTGPSLNYSLKLLRDDVPHFFRLAYAQGGDRIGDWTMPATLWPNGTWVEPAPGPSY
ncbi:hypothetical protein PENSPDRAFT_648216 [Peniophora sp. CONT]|nr:hypothetical protein PENSPDRAFT_648216 [Peniophora sp. CONT]